MCLSAQDRSVSSATRRRNPVTSQKATDSAANAETGESEGGGKKKQKREVQKGLVSVMALSTLHPAAV